MQSSKASVHVAGSIMLHGAVEFTAHLHEGEGVEGGFVRIATPDAFPSIALHFEDTFQITDAIMALAELAVGMGAENYRDLMRTPADA